MRKSQGECRPRVCRACNESYDYPAFKSSATRFHCERCADLPADVRAVFEKYNRRVKAMAAQLDSLQRECRTIDRKPPSGGQS